MVPSRICVVLVIFASLIAGLTAFANRISETTLVPAFVWSNHRSLSYEDQRVEYQYHTSESLAATLVNEFLWPKEEAAPIDVVVAFIGTKLDSVDISRGTTSASSLLQLLKASFSASNYSLAIPYVTLPENKWTVADVFLATAIGSLDIGKKLGKVFVSGSCSYNVKGITRLSSLQSVKDYLLAWKKSEPQKGTDFLVVCSSNEIELMLPNSGFSEGEVLSEIFQTLEEVKMRYVSLYTSDLTDYKKTSKQHRELGQLATGNNTVFCDEICQTKASLLEGLFVGIVLLIILISGICCMMGIDAPSRFEISKES